MTDRRFIGCALAILALATVLRTVWLTADPPNTATPGVGIVWHDEGAWVHNARNRALWGVWRTDNWNPIFLAPVFTTLEYATFHTFGVGTWQARTVPVVSGVTAVAFLIAGVAAFHRRAPALTAGALLAVNYVSVMWNRAALMESTMTALVVISWSAYAMASRRSAWGGVAGIASVLAFLTKASAAFFVAALAFESVMTLVLARQRGTVTADTDKSIAGATWTLIGLGVGAAAALVFFALPHWTEFRFYNWQMSVTRKPEYSIRALMTRASWLPVVHDFFTWMWPLFAVACVSIVGVARNWRSAAPSMRLLVLWVLVGFAELVVHDSGNERRYLMFIPALIALSTTCLFSTPQAYQLVAGVHRPRRALWVAPLVAALAYLAAASLLRVFFLDDVRAGHLHTTVVLSAGVAVAMTVAWRRGLFDWLRAHTRSLRFAFLLPVLLIPLSIDVRHFGQWARTRQYKEYDTSVELGRLLPPGTLVQGKLANGMALENQIRPIFIGHGFGNFDDRLQRDDVRYILTYTSPSLGFESQAGSDMIQQLLNRYPERRVVATFDVNETGGPDRAALIDKSPGTTVRVPN